jgi:hypothetical protein
MANLFHLEGRPADAVTLLVAIALFTNSIGLKIDPELQEPYDKTLAETRKKLPEHDFQSVWETDEKMYIEQAVKFAMEN